MKMNNFYFFYKQKLKMKKLPKFYHHFPNNVDIICVTDFFKMYPN